MNDVNPKAPAGKFRVIGHDDFPVPPEEYLIADCETLDAAKKLAESHVQQMNPVFVYDSDGQCVAEFDC